MAKQTLLDKTIIGIQNIGIDSTVQCFANSLPFAHLVYSKIPKGLWKKFFDEEIIFDMSLQTEPAMVFFYQDARIKRVQNSSSGEIVADQFMARNFNRLVEAILHPGLKKCDGKLFSNETTVAVLVPENFIFTDEDFAALQDAFTGNLQLERKHYQTVKERELTTGLFFEFSIWEGEYRPEKMTTEDHERNYVHS